MRRTNTLHSYCLVPCKVKRSELSDLSNESWPWLEGVVPLVQRCVQVIDVPVLVMCPCRRQTTLPASEVFKKQGRRRQERRGEDRRGQERRGEDRIQGAGRECVVVRGAVVQEWSVVLGTDPPSTLTLMACRLPQSL